MLSLVQPYSSIHIVSITSLFAPEDVVEVVVGAVVTEVVGFTFARLMLVSY